MLLFGLVLLFIFSFLLVLGEVRGNVLLPVDPEVLGYKEVGKRSSGLPETSLTSLTCCHISHLPTDVNNSHPPPLEQEELDLD